MAMRLYVGNLPYTTTEEELRNFFHPVQLGDIKFIAERETGRPRGFAFVDVLNQQTVQNVVQEFDGRQLGGRTLVVSVAQERQKRPDSRPRYENEPQKKGRDRRNARDKEW